MTNDEALKVAQEMETVVNLPDVKTLLGIPEKIAFEVSVVNGPDPKMKVTAMGDGFTGNQLCDAEVAMMTRIWKTGTSMDLEFDY